MTSAFETFKPDQTEAKLLSIGNMPGYLFRERGVHLDRITNYTSSTDGLKPLSVKKDEQIADYRKVVGDPTHAPYVMCISSEPNDLAAKTMAGIIMLAAHRAKANPRWHNLIGGYKDELRDKPWTFSKHGLLVLSNITGDSTDVKIEKLRDLLETFSNVPRIVTLTGAEPVFFFNAIGYPLHYSVWLRSERTTRVLGQ